MQTIELVYILDPDSNAKESAGYSFMVYFKKRRAYLMTHDGVNVASLRLAHDATTEQSQGNIYVSSFAVSNPEALRNLLETKGFEVKETYTFGPPIITKMKVTSNPTHRGAHGNIGNSLHVHYRCTVVGDETDLIHKVKGASLQVHLHIDNLNDVRKYLEAGGFSIEIL